MGPIWWVLRSPSIRSARFLAVYCRAHQIGPMSQTLTQLCCLQEGATHSGVSRTRLSHADYQSTQRCILTIRLSDLDPYKPLSLRLPRGPSSPGQSEREQRGRADEYSCTPGTSRSCFWRRQEWLQEVLRASGSVLRVTGRRCAGVGCEIKKLRNPVDRMERFSIPDRERPHCDGLRGEQLSICG
jgi:hypothetical protein